MPYTLQQLSDREEIRDAALRYCHGLDRLDPDWMRSAYWPDAVDEHGTFNGNAYEFVDYCMAAHERWKWTNHAIFTHQIELDEDGVHARGEIYNQTSMERVEGGVIDTWYGRYQDLYEKRGDEWKILHRVCVHHGTASMEVEPMPMASEKYRQADYDRPSSGRPLGP